jgi:Transposase IS66 family.
MTEPEPEDNCQQIEELEEENQTLRKELTRVQTENDRLREEVKKLEKLLRSKARSATPFSKGKRKAHPKRPGRKPGQGPFQRRDAPPAAAEAEPVQVPVTSMRCSGCGGELKWQRTDRVTNTDMPAQPQPEVKVYDVAVCVCTACGKSVRGEHPEVAADQYGATAHRVGPRLKTMAHALHYGHGVPVRRLPAILLETTGVTMTQGAITRDALKQASGVVGNAYQEARAGIRQAPVIYTDDTSWAVGGEPAQLMVFDTDQATVYQIRPQHRHQEVCELVPGDYPGNLVTDRGPSYEAKALAGVDQQKCLSHLMRNLKEVVETKNGRAREFGEGVLHSLKQANQLWRDHRVGKVDREAYRQQGQEIEDLLTHQLRHRQLTDLDNQCLLDGIGLQNDRGRVLRFLHNPAIEPTNNRAERALRPAVIARKVSQCSKTQRGAEAFAAFTTVIRTIAKKAPTAIAQGLHSLLHPADSGSVPPQDSG